MDFRMLIPIALACIWPGAAHATWHEASSDHFVIYADDSEADITRFAQQLERYHAGIAFSLGYSPPRPSPSNRVTVFVVKNERQVRALHGGDNKYVAGFYVPRAGGSVAIVPAVRQSSREPAWSMTVLLHEYAHHFLISTSSASVPRWYNEGAAEFFASARFEPDGGMWLGRPAHHRAAELNFAQDVTASDLLDPSGYERRKGSGYDAFYGKSWLLTHYLTFEPARAGQLSRYLDLLRRGKGMREAGLEAFGDFAQLEKELDKYKSRTRLSALRLEAAALAIGPVKVRAVTPGEAEMIPVRIQSRSGVSSDEAKSLLAEARTIARKYPADGAVLAALAECEHDAGNDKEAIAAADAAIKADPSQVNAYVQKGLSLFRIAADAEDAEAAYKAARAPFIALNRLEHDHPLPLAYFYRSYVEQGKRPTELAVRGLFRAVELAPFDFGLRMTLGTALIRLGQPADATVVLAPVAFDPHGSEISEFARAMIARIEKEPDWRGEDIATPSAGGEGKDS